MTEQMFRELEEEIERQRSINEDLLAAWKWLEDVLGDEDALLWIPAGAVAPMDALRKAFAKAKGLDSDTQARAVNTSYSSQRHGYEW